MARAASAGRGSKRAAAVPSPHQPASSSSSSSSSSISTSTPTPLSSPATLDTSPLTGLRVILNLWIMVFHAIFVMMYFVTDSEVRSLFNQVGIIQHGYVAVDGFLILSGFLLALPLLTEWKKKEKEKDAKNIKKDGEAKAAATSSVWDRIHSYWRGRFLRVMVPYAFVIFLHCFVINRCGTYKRSEVRLSGALEIFNLFFGKSEEQMALPLSNGCDSIPANFLHLSFLVPFNGALMHSWSLGVQYHVWLWFPVAWYLLDLGRGNRLRTATLILAGAASVFRLLAHHTSSNGFEQGSVTGSFQDLFWYSSPLARAHLMVAGVLAAQICVEYAPRMMTSEPSSSSPSTTKSKELSSSPRSPRATWHFAADLAAPAIFLLFLGINTQWMAMTGDDSRYTRGLHHRIFASLLQVGTPLASFVWSLLLLWLVWRPGQLSNATANFLGRSFWKFPADLSFHAFLLHPVIMTYLYSTPAFLFPSSAADLRPGADVPALLDAASAVPMVGSLFLHPLASAWFALREMVMPSGVSLSYSTMILLHAGGGILVTYIVSLLALYAWEQPIYKVLTRQAFKQGLMRVVKCYSWAVMVVGAIFIPFVTFGVMWFLVPEVEGMIKEHFAAIHSGNASTAGGGV